MIQPGINRMFLAATSLLLVSCTSMCSGSRGSMTPEQVVEAYLDIALNMTDIAQRDDLLEYTTGNLKEAIEHVSDSTIQTAYLQRGYKMLRYSVVERRDRTPRETEITFQLEYNDLGTDNADPANAPKVETENTVSVIKKEGIWYIQEVLGHKTAIDFPVSAESRITAKPGVVTPIEEVGDEPPADEPPTEDDAEG